MPSSRQRAHRSSNASGGRRTPPTSPLDSSSAVLSASLSTSTPRRKEELSPSPSKKRRVDNISCSADEDDLSCSPLICKRSWETFESDYKFLMEEDIIGTCQVSNEIDLEYRKILTGGQFGAEPEEDSSSSKVSLQEFLQQFSELSQWLGRLEARRPPALSCRVEKYAELGFAEELLQQQPRKKMLHAYAEELLQRHPQMRSEVGERLNSLEAQWATAEQQNVSLGASPVEPDLLRQILKDIEDDIADLNAWLVGLNEELPSSHAWMQRVVQLTPAELKEKLKFLEIQQSDIKSRSRCISHVIRVIKKLQQHEEARSTQPLQQLLENASGVEARCHEAWLQSLELLCCTEDQLKSPRGPPANQSEASDQSAIPALMHSSQRLLPDESLDFSSRSEQTKESSTSSVEPPLRSKSTSFDILPFSEDEYEKIAASSSSMRCQSIDLQGEADRTAAKIALLAEDLCYDDADLSRGIVLNRETTRDLIVHRQDGSVQLPGPVVHDGDSYTSQFTTDWEFSSTEWRSSETSQLFGPSRSAEVLLGEDVDLDVSQVHAVLSVTPKKAYYRMTVLDHELSHDSSGRPPRTSVSAPEGFASQLEEGAIGGALPGGEQEEEEEVETLVSPGASPDPHTSTPCASGQKRRYSRSFCQPAEGAAGLEISPILEDQVRRRQENSMGENSARETGGRSGSWRQLIGQLERDVRFSGSGSLIFGGKIAAEDDTGSLADESSSSEAGGQRTGVSRAAGGRVRRIRHRVSAAGLEDRRRSTSLQLADEAEKIVTLSRLGHEDSDSPASERYDELDGCGPIQEDSWMQQLGWDNYQHLYPSACDDDDEEEEKLDLQWDEQMEASINRRRDPECLYSDCERMLTHSSQLLERARNSLGRSPQFSQDSHSQDAVDGGIVVPSHAEVANKSLDAFDGGDVAPSHTEAPNDVAELEREFSRQKEWLQACENNLTYLDHLKESLTDSGVEDDLDPIRQQVEHLYKEWLSFKEETLARLGLIETLRFVHEEGDVVKREAQRLADLIDAAANQRFQDRSQLDKFVGVLKDYISQVPIWLQTVEAMHRSVLESLENDHVDYLDVRKCYFENLHLLTQWISSLNSRTEGLLRKMTDLCEQHSALLAQLFDIDASIGREEQRLRCTSVSPELIEAGELQTTCYDLQALSGRLLALGDTLDGCMHRASRLSPHFVAGHWQHMDARLSCAANRLAQLQEACAALLSAVSAELRGPMPRCAEDGPKGKAGPAVAPRRARTAVPALWRLLRASLPYQLALLVLFGCFYFLLAEDCPLSSKLLLSPQLRYAFGGPY